MPDITMCKGGECPKKETCYRFTAAPSMFRQSYFFTPPNIGNECLYYWKVEDESKPIEKEEM